MFAKDVKGNSARSTHMSSIDKVLGMQIQVARLKTAVNFLLPEDPIFPQLCSDRRLFLANHMNVSLVRSHLYDCSLCAALPQIAFFAFPAPPHTACGMGGCRVFLLFLCCFMQKLLNVGGRVYISGGRVYISGGRVYIYAKGPHI